MSMKISLVFPAYNEGQNIFAVLEKFSRYLKEHNLQAELIVVDDGSTDSTTQEVLRAKAGSPEIKLIRNQSNQGYGAALSAGFATAKGEFIFFTDSDGQFSPDALDATLPLIRPDTVVAGYRQARADNVLRRTTARSWNVLIRVLIGVSIRDINCAWKIFPQALVAEPLKSRGAFINAELMQRAKQQGLQIVEIPVPHYQRLAGHPTGLDLKVIVRAGVELCAYSWLRLTSSRTRTASRIE